MSELNRLLRQAARITAEVTPQPDTERAVADHEGLDGKQEPAYVTALDGVKKVSSRKQADPSPNIAGDFADESHKGDAAYETIYETDKAKWASRKKAEFPPAEEKDVEFEGSADAETAGEVFGGESEGECEGDECGVTNADVVESLEDVKQGIEDIKVEAGDGPAAELMAAIQEVIDAVDSIQNAVSEDAMSDPAAVEEFKTASNFKNYFIKERNIKAAKVIRQKLAAHQAAKEEAAKPKKANVKRAFDPKSIKR